MIGTLGLLTGLAVADRSGTTIVIAGRTSRSVGGFEEKFETLCNRISTEIGTGEESSGKALS